MTSVDTIQLALRGGLPNYQSQGSFDVPQLSTNLPLEPLPLLIDPQLTVPAGAGDTPSASKESTRFSTPLSPVPASSHPPSPCGSEATIPDTIGSASHTSNIRNREMSARTNLATARTNMAGKYNRHHQVESFAIGQYITIRIPREDRPATDNKRSLCRVVPYSARPLQASGQSPICPVRRQMPCIALRAFFTLAECSLRAILESIHTLVNKGGKINRRKIVVRSSVMPNRRINRCQILTIGGIKTYALYLYFEFPEHH